MKQPELGVRIAGLRIQNSMTQKELADLCNVDIRTIQRIEAGEVVPRMHTLRLLSTALGFELSYDNDDMKNNVKETGSRSRLSFIAGIIFSINAIPVVFYLITGSLNSLIYLLSIIIHISSSIFFYRGFYLQGRQYGNAILAVSSMITIILLPLINLMELFKNYLFTHYSPVMITPVIFTLLCINAIVFGIGLGIESNKRKGLYRINLYTTAGILTIIQSVLFISMNFTLIGIGLTISIGTNILLTLILYREYRHPGKGYIKTSQPTVLAW